MANKLFGGKSSRTKIFTVISAVAIILLLLVNLFVTSFGIFGNFYIDLTPEGLYTVRDIMYDVCDGILYMEDGYLREPGITVTFCSDPDYLIENTYTRVVYYMARALESRYDNFRVECHNVAMDPTSVARFKTTSLTEINANDVIVSYGDNRYRIASAESFWVIGKEKVYSFDGEYKLASIMLSLTLVDRPKAYFVTDHGEDYYKPTEGITDEAALKAQEEMNEKTSHLFDLLTEKGLAVDTLSLSGLIEEAEKAGKQPDIPDDCVILIINDPKLDFREDSSKFGSYSYVSETELLDRYLAQNKGSVMIAKDYKTVLPIFEDFLSEWGLKFSNTLVKDTASEGDGQTTTLVSEYITETDKYAYQIYENYATLASAPRLVVEDSGYIMSSFGDNSVGMNDPGTANTSRIYAPFIYTSENAVDYAKNDKGEYVYKSGDAGKKALAALGNRQTIDTSTSNLSHSYIFAAASASFFSSELLGNPSCSNYEICAALVQNIARLDTYAPEELGGLSGNNNTGFLGKILTDIKIYETDTLLENIQNTHDTDGIFKQGLTPAVRTVYTVIIAAIPVAIAVVGIVICVRRKYL